MNSMNFNVNDASDGSGETSFQHIVRLHALN